MPDQVCSYSVIQVCKVNDLKGYKLNIIIIISSINFLSKTSRLEIISKIGSNDKEAGNVFSTRNYLHNCTECAP